MIDRESVARVLDPVAWSAEMPADPVLAFVHDWEMHGRRNTPLAAADRLLSHPRYAVVELPEWSKVYRRFSSWAPGDLFRSGDSVHIQIERGPLTDDDAEFIGAFIVAFARKSEEKTP